MEKSQATATWDLDTRDDQKDYLFFAGGGYGVNLPACRGLGGGQEEVWGWDTWGISWAGWNKGLANHSSELKR